MCRVAIRLAAILALLIGAAPKGIAGEVRVAVASNFLGAVHQLVPVFEARSGDTVTVSAGSTGKLYAQISQGAPFDVFLAADARRPRLLEEQGLALPGSRFTYARGQLALWRGGGALPAHPWDALVEPGVRFVSIANPRTAPYGEAARQALEAAGLWDRVRGRLVMGENIAQTYQYVATGNAQVGLVALAQVHDAPPESRWLVPQRLYAPIDQQAVRLTAVDAGARFLSFLRGAEARRMIAAFGYGLPGGD